MVQTTKATGLIQTYGTNETPLIIGERIRLIQKIPFGSGCWASCIEGIILRIAKEKTGAWFTHSKGKKLWLDRIIIRRDSGEICSCILDQLSHLELPLADVTPETIQEKCDTDVGNSQVSETQSGPSLAIHFNLIKTWLAIHAFGAQQKRAMTSA